MRCGSVLRQWCWPLRLSVTHSWTRPIEELRRRTAQGPPRNAPTKKLPDAEVGQGGVIGTNNVDTCSSLLPDPATMRLQRTEKYGSDAGSIADMDIEEVDRVLMVRSNTAESDPVLATRAKRSHKLRGQRLIVADLRKHEMAERAELFIRPKPSSDAV